ncbi:MAG: L-2-hydroxyglutarate oxidase [Solirubrobacteraceae bacterium]
MKERVDIAVVGGGILGLATARELQRRRPSLTVCVLEREAAPALHQSSHNSGVVHAGVYYAPGSLKARLCREGAREMYRFCEQRCIVHARCGKLIVAAKPSELPRLDELERRGRASGVVGLRRVGPGAIRELEPHATGLAGLHSPQSGIADFAQVARTLAADVLAAGGAVECGAEVRRVEQRARSVRLEHARGTLEAAHAVFCAGAWADRMATAAGADPDPRIVPFRGTYLRLKPHRRELVQSLIYPVADPALPFLGVHLTRHPSGDVLLGPTALLSGARDAGVHVRAGDLLSTLAWPGSWRMAARFWRAGLSELAHAASRRSLVQAAARLLPELCEDDVELAWSGVRAQALSRKGHLVDDFVFSRQGRTLHVRNAPSPGATSSLAIARYVADEVERALSF